MKRDFDYLEMAKTRIADRSTSDPTSKLALANLTYGIAKILYAQEYLGYKASACFITVPDFTVTRSNSRWLSGFSYGGLLLWGDGSLPFIAVETRPNACGTLVGRFDKLPSLESVLERIFSLTDNCSNTILWDYARRNHFFNIYRTPEDSKSEYYFLLHGCPQAVKEDSNSLPGLYIDKSAWIQQNCVPVETPFGQLNVLLNEHAIHYYECYTKHEEYAKNHRLCTAQAILGDFDVVSNETHSGLVTMNQQILGAYYTPPKTLLPIAISMNEDAYLCKSKQAIEDILESTGLYDFVSSCLPETINSHTLMPHGGGYKLHNVQSDVKVMIVNGRRHYVMGMGESGARLVVSNISEVPFTYRNSSDFLLNLKEHYLDISVVLKPELSLKI